MTEKPRRIEVARKTSPVTQLTLNLDQYTDRAMMEGKQDVEFILRPNPSEHETFEVRTDAGTCILNKGELRILGEAILDMSEPTFFSDREKSIILPMLTHLVAKLKMKPSETTRRAVDEVIEHAESLRYNAQAG